MTYKTRRYLSEVSDIVTGQLIFADNAVCDEIETYGSKRNKNGRYTARNPVVHRKTLEFAHYTYNGIWRMKNANQLAHVRNYPIAMEAKKGIHLGLDFQKNNSFQILPFLMDWDNTLASFAKRMIALKRPSSSTKYAAEQIVYNPNEVKYGLMPFLGEIKSLCDTLGDIKHRIFEELESLQGKRITRRFESRFRGSDGAFDYEIETVTRIQGFLTGDLNFPIEPNEILMVLLDEMGFHPDLATVWEVIPLSFVVDYFFPVGDFLESLKPRGWFNPVFRLDGTISTKSGIELRGSGTSHKGFGGYYSVYERGNFTDPIPTRPLVLPRFSLDELIESAGANALDIMQLAGPVGKKRK